MLKRLHLQNFTVFADADFEFVPGLNVIVGTNGTGKSHVLKVGYAVLNTATGRLKYNGPRKVDDLNSSSLYNGTRAAWGKHNWSMILGDKLKSVFRPEPYELTELVRHNAKEADLMVLFGSGTDMESRVRIAEVKPTELELGVDFLTEKTLDDRTAAPVFLPPKEVLTMAWLLADYELRQLPLDETYPDLLRQLNQLPLREPNPAARKALDSLEMVLGGKVEEKGGRFYLEPINGKKMEMNLVAEGIRKFAILDKLLRNGSLSTESTLFWDEPEANLNPALLRKLAAILAELARQGFQIILATHSMSLLKEFHILSRQKDAKPLPIKYFGLNAEPGEATRIVFTDNFEYLPDVVALAEDLKQADELEDVFIRDDQQFYVNNPGNE